jgi:hypothetical protein
VGVGNPRVARTLKRSWGGNDYTRRWGMGSLCHGRVRRISLWGSNCRHSSGPCIKQRIYHGTWESPCHILRKHLQCASGAVCSVSVVNRSQSFIWCAHVCPYRERWRGLVNEDSSQPSALVLQETHHGPHRSSVYRYLRNQFVANCMMAAIYLTHC